MILKSRYIVPVDAPVIEHGAVTVRAGRIEDVGSARNLPQDTVIDCGDAVICPGFVNAHTHLELSLLANRVPQSGDLIDWLEQLMKAASSTPPTRDGVLEATRQGIELSVSSGVTMIGDISRSPVWTREALATSPLRGVSFGEVSAIGQRRNLLDERLAAAVSSDQNLERMHIGISPHAPYSVEPDAMRACAEQAQRLKAPLSIHLAETPDERFFTRFREGRFVSYLKNLGIWDDIIPVGGCDPVILALQTGVLTDRTTIAHANYVTDDDITAIAGSGASVAYCPRTHEAFGHPPHRFREMHAAGINVCLGTDSLASNPSLSILDELRFMHAAHDDLDVHRLVQMGTIHGAMALGLAEQAGSIAIGKAADLVVLPLDTMGSTPPWWQILESDVAPTAVYINGVQQEV